MSKFQSSLLSLPLATLHRRTMGLLRDKDVITSEGNLTDFELLREIWFDFYPRNKNTNRTSSGFEHVFLSEIKKGKIIGWVRVEAERVWVDRPKEDYFRLTSVETLILLKLITILPFTGNLCRLHNWLYFHEFEKVGKLDYLGWYGTRNIEDVSSECWKIYFYSCAMFLTLDSINLTN